MDSLPRIAVSAATARYLRAGHPWVRRDRHTGSMEGRKAGQLGRLVDPRGQMLGVALLDPGNAICARWLHPGALPQDWVEQRAQRALALRAPIEAEGHSLLRLIHGEADGLPGLTVDRFGGMALITTRCAAAATLVTRVRAVLARLRPTLACYHKEHHRDLRKGRPGERLPGRWLGADPGERVFVGVEHGLRFATRPLEGLTTGFYPDQRENRRLLRRHAAGRSALNLFAHTGAFSVSLLAGGARRVVSVDRAARYVGWIDENLELNGLGSDAHEGRVEDAVAYLKESKEKFDLIVLDPPSFAGGGRSRWDLKKQMPGMLSMAWRRLRPGGLLLGCTNLRELGRDDLLTQLRRFAGGGMQVVGSVGPGTDHPVLPGFPESRQHSAVLVRRR